jgi:hypothetical protein
MPRLISVKNLIALGPHLQLCVLLSATNVGYDTSLFGGGAK